jgi:hypothetical protein
MSDRKINLVASAMPTEDDMQAAVELLRDRILDRTARGVDYQENPFTPYSTKGPKGHSYADFKASLGSSNVDLRGKGSGGAHMLDQIDADAEGLTASLSIDGSAGDRATWINEGTSKMPQREFFNASDDDIQAMQELIADRILDRWNHAA